MGVSNQQAYGLVGAASGTGGTADLSMAKGGGKTSIQKALNSVIQVNAAPIVGYYEQGASTLHKYYQQGLDYYANAVDEAGKEIKNAYSEANITLAPLSQAGQAALSEQMRMLGLNSISPTVNYYQKLNTLASQDKDIAALQSQLQATEKITDAAARQQAKTEILNKLNTLQTSVDTKAQEAIDKLGPAPTAINVNAEVQKQIDEANAKNAAAGKIVSPYNEQRLKDRVQADADAQQKKVDEYNQQVKSIKEQASTAKDFLQQFTADYNQNYSTDSTGGYTGEEMQSKLEQTPGYQSQLKAGTDALARQAAATGMLSSGNTGMALIDYGQNVSQTYYNNYLTSLGNIATLGSQATNAIANNQVGQGQSLSQLETLLGGAGASTYQGIGAAYDKAYTNMAQAKQQIAMFNAQMIYNSKQANLNRSQQSAIAGQQASAGMLNAATNAAQFNYGVYQNQQQANAFAANTMTPLQQYTGYWGTPSATGWSL